MPDFLSLSLQTWSLRGFCAHGFVEACREMFFVFPQRSVPRFNLLPGIQSVDALSCKPDPFTVRKSCEKNPIQGATVRLQTQTNVQTQLGPLGTAEEEPQTEPEQVDLNWFVHSAASFRSGFIRGSITKHGTSILAFALKRRKMMIKS